jgi:hypothetical protein
MDAAMIARVMSVIPERAVWTHTGAAFAAHENQGAQVLYLAKFLQWTSPLTVLTKDDQRALGLLATHQRPVEDLLLEEDGELVEDGELIDELDDFDPDATLPRLVPGALEHGIQQDVAAGRQVLGAGVLDLVVADAAFAGHEDHRRGGDAREVHGIVAGAADDVAVTKA